MKIIKKEESIEQCTEAGWYAYDYELEREMFREDILRFREFEADFIYLTALKQPFFKVEDRYYMIKGVEGKNVIRLSMYREYEEEICQKVETFIRGILLLPIVSERELSGESAIYRGQWEKSEGLFGLQISAQSREL